VHTQEVFEKQLRAFVETLAQRTVRSNSRLFEHDYLDSLKVLDLISFIEAKLKIRIEDEQITLDNFRTIRVIADAFWNLRR
jgi:acyl carrier protein